MIFDKKLDEKLKRIMTNTPKPKKCKTIGQLHRNIEGICPICNKKLKTKDKREYQCGDGTSPYIRLYLNNKKMDGIYHCHLECYFILHKCIKETIDFYGEDYGVFDL